MSLPIKYHPLTDDFVITKNVLGVGINGKVVESINKSNSEIYATKVLKDEDRSRKEAELHYRASDCGELFQRIQQRSDQPFTEREASTIMLSICSAVDYLHTMNIAHRDLKPENFLYTDNSSDAILKLTDFGFAKECGSNNLQTPCYTPYYVAPEVLGSGRYDKSCDMWSVGVIMYILLCGYPPFYSVSGVAFSPGMRKRIHAGQYEFPPNEWDLVSDEGITPPKNMYAIFNVAPCLFQNAKDLIRAMLDTDPTNRLTIKQLMESPWISRNRLVPQTPLQTNLILLEEKDNWPQIQREFANALQNMRVDPDKNYLQSMNQIKNINPIMAKRLNNVKSTELPNAMDVDSAEPDAGKAQEIKIEIVE